MSVGFYMDVHVRRQVTQTLRNMAIDVLTAQEDDTTTLSDPELLDRASLLQRVLFSQDTDLLVEAADRQRNGLPFFGVVYCHQTFVPVSRCISNLALIAKCTAPDEWTGRVEFLPLK